MFWIGFICGVLFVPLACWLVSVVWLLTGRWPQVLG